MKKACSLRDSLNSTLGANAFGVDSAQQKITKGTKFFAVQSSGSLLPSFPFVNLFTYLSRCSRGTMRRPERVALKIKTTVPKPRAIALGEPRFVRGQRSIYIWENPKYSIKPRSFQNRAYGFLHTAQEKLPAILFNLSHG